MDRPAWMVLHVGIVGHPVDDVGGTQHEVDVCQRVPGGQGRKSPGDHWPVSMDQASHVHGVAVDHAGVGVRVVFILARGLVVAFECRFDGEALL